MKVMHTYVECTDEGEILSGQTDSHDRQTQRPGRQPQTGGLWQGHPVPAKQCMPPR